MKQLASKEYIPSRIYYYLLDFKDRDKTNMLLSITQKDSIYSLTKEDAFIYFAHATTVDKLKLNEELNLNNHGNTNDF
jgi:hypothetical protein